MEDDRNPPREESSGGGSGSSNIEVVLGENLLHYILSKLSAVSFASAACVSRSWNLLCNRVLSRPKLSSSFSLNYSLEVAVKEVVDKVLSEPLRPHFAIASVSPSFNLTLAHKLITEKLGSTIPVVTHESSGVIGRDAITNEFKEVQWGLIALEDSGVQGDNGSPFVADGILLTVGFVPGLEVDAIPLLRVKDNRGTMIDQFVMDIKEYSAWASGWESPAGIIMFGGPTTEMKPVLDKMDHAMSLETVIVGDESGNFLYRRKGNAGNTTGSSKYDSVGVALLFARDRYKPHGIGDIEFHASLSTGVSPIGPTFMAAVVKERHKERSTNLTAKREESHVILDGQTMLNGIKNQMGNRIEYPVVYIGVQKRRRCSVGLEKARWMTFFAFHEVTGGDNVYLFVNGNDIKTRDSFCFYHSDSTAALSSCSIVSENFRRLKQDWDRRSCHKVSGNASNGKKKEVFGGMIFACCGRGEYFFGRSKVDSSPFLENFPGVPLAGTFCNGEIGRCSSSLYGLESQEQTPFRCSLHAFSSVYLVMSYTPP